MLTAVLATFASLIPLSAATTAEPTTSGSSTGRPGDADRFVNLFRPNQSDLATLSPDGRHLAYSLREQDKLSVIVIDLDNPGTAKAKVLVGDDQHSTAMFSQIREKTPAAIKWMKWVTSDRLVVDTNGEVGVSANASVPGMIMGFDADGGNFKVLVTARKIREDLPRDFVQRGTRNNRPLAPTVDDPNFLQNGSGAALNGPGSTGGSIATGLFGNVDSSSVRSSTTRDPSTAALFGAQPSGTVVGETEVEINDTISTPLSPSVFDLDPANPGAVLVRAVGRASVVVYSLDASSGKLKLLLDHAFEPDLTYLLDRQGVPRIAVPADILTAFPHRFTLERGPGVKISRNLDKLASLYADTGFSFSPANFFLERTIPVGFDEKPEILYFASNAGRDTYGIYSVNLATGKRSEIAIEHPQLDLIPRPDGAFVPPGTLVYDRFTRNLVGIRMQDELRSTLWLHPVLKAVQGIITKALPGRNVDLLEWDTAAKRFLALVSGPSDAGGFVLFDASTKKLTQYARRAPWLDSMIKNRTVAATLTSNTGLTLPCQLTLSQTFKVKPLPVIVVCPSAPWERFSSDFQPEIQALADMGFAVLQLSGRGAWGYGIKYRESIHSGYDIAQVQDILRAIDGLAQAFTLDTKRVGIVGAGYGGYLALRALQLHPNRFRCGVALEAPVKLEKWLKGEQWTTRAVAPQLVRAYYGTKEHLHRAVLERDAEKITKPLLLFSYPGRDGESRRDTYLSAKSFAHAVRRPEVEVEFVELSQAFAAGLPRARAAVYRDMELFINAHVYNFNVKVGETKVAD